MSWYNIITISSLAEHQRTDAFELWFWRRLLRVAWTAMSQYVPVNIKGAQPWIFIGRTDAEAEVPIFRQSDVKSWLIRKDPDTGKDWRQKKGMTEDKMFGWHHWHNGHEFKQAVGGGVGQGTLTCWSPWGCKELDSTEWLNNNQYFRGLYHKNMWNEW